MIGTGIITRMNRRLFATLVVPLLLAPAACGQDSKRQATPPQPSAAPIPTVTPGAACLTAPERGGLVRFPSDNGASIAGVVLGAGAPGAAATPSAASGPGSVNSRPGGAATGRVGIVLAHQTKADMCQWVPYGRTLAGLGYTVLAIDLNGYGASSPSRDNPARAAYDRDIVAAAAQLRQLGVRTVALIGASLGGMSAVAAAAQIAPAPAAVVDLSGPAMLSGTDAAAAAPKVTAPALFLVGADDSFADDVRKVSKAATQAKENRLEVIAGSRAHGVALLDPASEPKAAQVAVLIQDFIAKNARA